MTVLVLTALTSLVPNAMAGRPENGGDLYSYQTEDVLAYVDGPAGEVRVTYSVSGPNVVKDGDDDDNGVPDFAEDVAVAAEAVLEAYAGLGFRRPLSEAEVGLGELGGSGAFDFYLLDFGGNADGMFSTDACEGQVCAGHMLMENDFQGYGYSSIATAIGVLTSHELFHAVQAAYRNAQPSWIAEGTAVWGEYQLDPDNEDFLAFCDAYLDDTDRSLDEPPIGPVPAFSYGTALFWQYLTGRFGTEVIVALQEAEAEVDGLDAVEAAVTAVGGDLGDEWAQFVRWNLATGGRSGGGQESYTFAAEIGKVSEEAEGEELVDDNRFYPLAATYYWLEHPGGELSFATLDDPGGIRFSLHPASGKNDPVEAATLEWAPEDPGVVALGELEEGGYWVAGTYPVIAEESNKIAFCLGDENTVEACEATDTGSLDSEEKAEVEGCGCGTAANGGGELLLGLGVLFVRRRRGSAPLSPRG